MKLRKMQKELESGKRYGPMKATNVRVVDTRHMDSPMGSLAMFDDDPPHERPDSNTFGFVSKEVYDELLERFHQLQTELAERDILIAQMQLELAQMRHTAIIRSNRLLEMKPKDNKNSN